MNKIIIFLLKSVVRFSRTAAILILLLFTSCISEPMESKWPVGAEPVSRIYNGLIIQHLINDSLQECPIVITYQNNRGTFYTKEPHLYFIDSIRITKIDGDKHSGFLFFDNQSFEEAYSAIGDKLLNIEFTIKGDSLIGTTEKEFTGFWYSFKTKR